MRGAAGGRALCANVKDVAVFMSAPLFRPVGKITIDFPFGLGPAAVVESFFFFPPGSIISADYQARTITQGMSHTLQ